MDTYEKYLKYKKKYINLKMSLPNVNQTGGSVNFLTAKFKIDMNKVNKRNKELVDSNWIDKLNKSQKKFLNWRKGPPKIMNLDGLFGYGDLSNYLINQDRFNEIDLNELSKYLSIYNIDVGHINDRNINENLKKILQAIQNKRIKTIQKYISIEDSIFKKGIYSNDTIYRTQDKPIEGNIIKNSTSWSLIPQEWFCINEECHLYITKIPKDLKVIYIENKSNDKELKTFNDFGFYEYEYILPKNLEFKEISTKIVKIPNKIVDDKSTLFNSFTEQKFICHTIKIIGKVNVALPKIKEIKLATEL